MAGGVGTFAVDEARLREVLQRLEAAAPAAFGYDRRDYAPALPPAGRALPPEIAELLTRWQATIEAEVEAVRGRQSAEANEKRAAESRERRLVQEFESRYLAQDAELEEEYTAARQVAADERRGRLLVIGALLAAFLLGVLVLPLGLIHRGFGVFGALVTLVFGVWLTAYSAMMPFAPAFRRVTAIRAKRRQFGVRLDELVRGARAAARRAMQDADDMTRAVQKHRAGLSRDAEQAYRDRLGSEVSKRQHFLRAAEESLTAVEGAWAGEVVRYEAACVRADSAVRAKAVGCRGLGDEYRQATIKLHAEAEAAGRRRHLSLHPVADASIPKVGAGRKQSLAAHGIFTAADVTEVAVRAVHGFGDALTANVLAWRDAVERSYQFNPATAVSPAEQRALALKFRGRQQQILDELARLVADLEGLTTACREEVRRLKPSLQAAVAAYEQAKADLQVMTRSPTT